MNSNFMKEEPILPLITSMALPMVISMMVNSLYNIVDSFFVAQISENAMTALSLVYPVQNFINAVSIGFGVGINALIAYYLGAGDETTANKAAAQGMLLSILHGIVLTIACIAVMPHFLSAFTADADVIGMGVRYSNIAFAFSIIIMVGLCYEKIFQAVGNMKVTMIALMAGCIVNIILDPLLIFGIGPFPEWGIEGAAVATGIGQISTLAIYLFVYKKYPMRITLSRKYLTANAALNFKLYAIGIPATLNLALPSLLVSALNTILAAYSQSYIVVLGIYYKLQTFLYLPANGIIQGMRPLVSFNYGAGEHERVKKIYYTTMLMNAGIMLAGTLICLAVPDKLIAMFTENTFTVEVGAEALKIICAGFIVSSVSVTACGALEGLGKGLPSLVISLLRYVVVIIPAAWLLSGWLGATGVWHAFWLAEFVTAIAAHFVYKKYSK